MASYKNLRDVLRSKRKELYDLVRKNGELITDYTDMESSLKELDFKDINFTGYNRITRYRSNFPMQNEEMDTLEKLAEFRKLIDTKNIIEFNFDEYDKLISYSSVKFGVPPYDVLPKIREAMEETKSVISGDYYSKPMKLTIDNDVRGLRSYVYATCQLFADTLIKYLLEIMGEHDDREELAKEKDEAKQEIELINKYYSMFSDDKLLTKFKDNELEEFIKYIKTLLPESQYQEIIKQVKEEQKYEEEVIEEVTFDNLDLSQFNDEEIEIINEIKDIFEDEELIDKGNPFKDVEISLKVRDLYYKESNMNDILLDVKYNLLNSIYTNKDEVISIFLDIIERYQKYSLKVIRNDKIDELQKIVNDLNNIKSFINKNESDREEAHKLDTEINGYINNIQEEIIPTIKDMISEELDYDEYYDGEIDNSIHYYNGIVNEWKKKMSHKYNNTDVESIDNKENKRNLVFCIADIDLSTPGIDREFVGTVEALENMSAVELKKGWGRNSMSRIKRYSESGKEENFVEYLGHKRRSPIHFTPFRYCSDPRFRTGLVKFDTSPAVKQFLEEHYGLSNQSACYGIFQIINSVGTDHSEYYYLRSYILNNCDYIEEIASLLVSDKPDFDKITNVIDGLLNKKKLLLESINNTK